MDVRKLVDFAQQNRKTHIPDCSDATPGALPGEWTGRKRPDCSSRKEWNCSVSLSFPIVEFNFLWLWLLQAGHILCVWFCCFFFVCLFIKTWSLVAQAGLELTKMTLNS